LVCYSSKIEAHDNLEIFGGNVMTLDDVILASQGCDYVINALNILRTSDFPCTNLRTPKHLISISFKNAIEASKLIDFKRVVSRAAWGVGGSVKAIPFWFRWLTRA